MVATGNMVLSREQLEHLGMEFYDRVYFVSSDVQAVIFVVMLLTVKEL